MQDETPLFLAAREGSYEACKILLDHFANRDITDHMDRLPKDIASERLHHDILQLLDEYPLNSPTGVTLQGLPGSPGRMQYMHQKHTKSKSRKKNNSGHSMANGLPNGVHQKKTKSKKKSSPKTAGVHNGDISSVDRVSPGSGVEQLRTPPSYESMYGTQAYTLSQQGIPTMNCGLPQGVLQSQAGRLMGCYTANGHIDPSEVPLWHQSHQHQQHMQQQMSNQIPQNQNTHQQQQQQQPNVHNLPQATPPHMSGSMSTSPMSISGSPSSLQSHGSPLSHGNPSPIKASKNLPTSPTHMQAMHQRARHHDQRLHESPHSVGETCQYQTKPQIDNVPPGVYTIDSYGRTQQHSNTLPKYMEHQFPTPPSQHSMESPQVMQNAVLPEHYLTPSPDSPGQWSSSSPHSNSDWSEGISSPDQSHHRNGTNPVYL